MGKRKATECFKIAEGVDLNKQNVVYSIENQMTGDKYVGVTTRKLKIRLGGHLSGHSKSKFSTPESRTPMYIDLNKYGPTIFVVRILFEHSNLEVLKAFEKEVQKNIEYEYYASNEKIGKTKHHHYRTYSKVVCTDAEGKRYTFKTQSECARHFKCTKHNVSKALKCGYKLNKKYIVTVE